MQHRLSNIDYLNGLAECRVCGSVRVWKDPSRSSGYRCSIKYDSKPGRRKKRWPTEPYEMFKKSSCEKCGFFPIDPCQLDVDHINGRQITNADSPENLQTLCANCHRLKTHRPELFQLERRHAT